MKAYKVRTKYAGLYAPVEEIEVHRLTGKSYLDNRGTFRRHTDYHSVYATKAEAIEHAKRVAKNEIAGVQMQLHRLQIRLTQIEAMEGSNSSSEEIESVEQMRQAPHKAVFFWRNTEFLEATRLAVIADRSDLEIYGIDGLSDARVEMFRGRRLSGVVVDHAAQLTNEQKRSYDWLRNVIVLKEVAP